MSPVSQGSYPALVRATLNFRMSFTHDFHTNNWARVLSHTTSEAQAAMSCIKHRRWHTEFVDCGLRFVCVGPLPVFLLLPFFLPAFTLSFLFSRDRSRHRATGCRGVVRDSNLKKDIAPALQSQEFRGSKVVKGRKRLS